MATRWRSPPDSWVGRRCARPRVPTRAERRGRLSPPLGRAAPRRRAARRPRCPARSGARPGRTAGRRSRCGWLVAQPSSRSAMRATSRPVMRTAPELGRSRVPMMCSRVSCPTPTGRRWRRARPWHAEAHAPQRRGPAGRSGRSWSPRRVRARGVPQVLVLGDLDPPMARGIMVSAPPRAGRPTGPTPLT